jgi:hypothetical protein
MASWDRPPWPHNAASRWALRLAFAFPLCVLAVWADRRGFSGVTNQELQRRAELARAGGGDLSGLSNAYPPLPTFLAGVLPWGTAGLAVCTAGFAGIAMQLLTARLVRRQVPIVLIGVLVLALIAVPALWFEATQNLSGFLALMFLVIALDGFVRFVARADTVGGFVAGLMLSAAFLCDPIALVYTVALGVAAPFVMPRHMRHEPGAMRATTSVLLFPIVAVIGAWAFLEWRFTGGAYATIRADNDWFSFDAGVGASFVDALQWVGEGLLRVPVYLAVGMLLVRRRGVVGVGYAVPPLIGLVLAHWIGFAYSPVLAFALLTLLALYSVPRWIGWRGHTFLGVAGLLQFAVVLQWDPAGGEFHRWAALLF